MTTIPTLQHTLDSRSVAEMVQKNHTDLLRNIRTYAVYFTESKIALSDFFQESSYADSTGRTLPCYLITRKGCEFIANKLTGQKGTLFTAAYINRFHEMEQGKHLPPPKPQYVTTPNDIKSQQEILKIQNNLTSMGVMLELVNTYADYNDYVTYLTTLKHLAFKLAAQCHDFSRLEVFVSDKPRERPTATISPVSS